MEGYIDRFTGQAKIRVRFRNAGECYKFYKYILKTEWTPGVPTPQWEEMAMDFMDADDVGEITRRVVTLLQYGFDVYSCEWKIEKATEEDFASEQSPPEDEPDEDDDWMTNDQIRDFLSRVVSHF